LTRATGGDPHLIPGGPEICRRIGVVTGGAGGDLSQAAKEGVDTFITGEGPHWTYAAAEEFGLNVLYGGHYATETFGVKALAAHLRGNSKFPGRSSTSHRLVNRQDYRPQFALYIRRDRVSCSKQPKNLCVILLPSLARFSSSACWLPVAPVRRKSSAAV